MAYLGYSTGAIALSDFEKALDLLSVFNFEAVELSALRIGEVRPLIEAIPNLRLEQYQYISFHAPSAFSPHDEGALVELLACLPEAWPIVLHPDAIHDLCKWKPISHRLAIENMDKRKGVGRSVAELFSFFVALPEAKMCLDIGHARQIDSSMVGAYQLMNSFRDRIVQLHISEVDVFNQHDIISRAAEIAFAEISRFIPKTAAIILEGRVIESQIESEATKVANLLFA